MKLSKRVKFLVFVTAIGGILFLSDIFLFSPLSKESKALNREIIKTEVALRKALELQSRKEQTLQEYKNIEEYLKLKGSDEEIVASFLREIETKARKAGVSIIDLKPQSRRQTGGDYREYLIDLRLEGKMEEIVDFIYGVESSKFLLKAKSVSLNLKDEATSLLKGEIKISGIVID
jgi:Tfp pilus assembly protein PilO